MLSCPHCGAPIELRKIKHEGLLASYRICPTCDGAFEVDPKTKKRQGAFIILALVSLVLTVLAYTDGWMWLPYALMSYLLLGGVVYHGNKRVLLMKSGGARHQRRRA